MIQVVHLFGPDTPDEAVAAAHQLVLRLPENRVRHTFVSLDGALERRVAGDADDGLDVHVIPRRFRFDLSVGPRLRRFVASRTADLIHAWELDAATTAAGALAGLAPLVATLTTPPSGGRWSRWFQAVGSGGVPPIACPAGIVRRRAIEAGVKPDNCAVIRPGVDFHAVAEAKRLVTRAALSIPDDVPVLLTLPTPTEAGGHFHGAWAAAILRHLFDGLRFVVPGVSDEQQRLRRFAAQLGIEQLYLFPERRQPFESLLAVADVVVVPAVDDAPTTPLAWAMAAGVPIVGSAVPAVTELIADRSNGLLCKPGLPIALAMRIRAALEDRDLTRRLAEAARGQAFEVFSMRRSADQYHRFYENVLAGKPPAEGIADAAMRS